jgi:cellulose synthase/poly-beta-1,6-N-acetylglucosamine synthase-like glycosyltransferase
MLVSADLSFERNSKVLPTVESVAPTGVSVIVCCHNSANRLRPTLAHLASQVFDRPIEWEVILVDNASSDGTGRLAQELWPKDAPAPLRVVQEPRLGVAYGRICGVSEARYEFLNFVDDDNWVCPNWIQLVWELMVQHPEVGVCGASSIAECELPPPTWFHSFSGWYAIGPQEAKSGDVTQTRVPYGAGFTLRKSAVLELEQRGFRTQLVGRQGAKLTAGEDSERCLAIRLAGWRLWHEPCLRFRHFVPAQRLEWTYLRRLARGTGMSSASMDAYFCAMKPKRTGVTRVLRRIRETWSWQLLAVAGELISQPLRLVSSLTSTKEGDGDLLCLEKQIGRCLGLLQMRKQYGARIREIRGLFQRSGWSRRNGKSEMRQLVFDSRRDST